MSHDTPSSEALAALVGDLKLWACSPRVPLKAQLVMLEAIGRLSAQSESVRSADSAGDSDRWQDPRDLSGGATDCTPSSVETTLAEAKYITDRFSREELAELDAALLSLSMALGNPAMIAAPPHSIESELVKYAAQSLRDAAESAKVPPFVPTEVMLLAACEWSYTKYGKPIGNEAAIGCWQSMYTALYGVKADGRDDKREGHQESWEGLLHNR